MNKNEFYEVLITDITDDGLGVGKVDNFPVFIKDAAVGDKLKIKITAAKKTYAYGIIEEITEKSPHRINPDCPVFSKCGGCALRHITYAEELRIKENRVYETMKRIGKVNIKPKPIESGNPDFYRNKAQYPVAQNGVGFYAPRSHRVAVSESCPLSPDEFSLAANEFYRFIKEKGISVYNEETKKGLVRHFCIRKGFVSGEIQAVAVINGDKMPYINELVKSLQSVLGSALKSVVINKNIKDTNVIYGEKFIVAFGKEKIEDTICGVKVMLSPDSFYQVNHDMAEALYNKAREYAKPKGKILLDLYCGTGTIGLSMANEAQKVIGVEVVKSAVNDAEENAKINGITNADFICSRAAEAVKQLKRKNLSPDIVVLDPPRKGCDEEMLKTVANGFCPERIVYISCNVATLARDTAILQNEGYTLLEYTPFDLFPRTVHVETVALFVRTDSAI